MLEQCCLDNRSNGDPTGSLESSTFHKNFLAPRDQRSWCIVAFVALAHGRPATQNRIRTEIYRRCGGDKNGKRPCSLSVLRNGTETSPFYTSYCVFFVYAVPTLSTSYIFCVYQHNTTHSTLAFALNSTCLHTKSENSSFTSFLVMLNSLICTRFACGFSLLRCDVL